jgi:hypothetical protein
MTLPVPYSGFLQLGSIMAAQWGACRPHNSDPVRFDYYFFSPDNDADRLALVEALRAMLALLPAESL